MCVTVVVILAILTTVLAIVLFVCGLRHCHKKVTKNTQNIPVTM